MFLDIALGIFSVIFISWFFHINPDFWVFLFAIIFTLLPDADFLFFYPKRGDTKEDYKHRDIIHYPLIYLPIGTSIIWLIFGKAWSLLFLVASFLHFVHDSIGIGWGIKWLYPFSRNNYAFFYLYSKKIKKGLRKFVFSFSEKELPNYVKEHGDADWVKNIYYKWHPIAVAEFLVFLMSIIILIIYIV